MRIISCFVACAFLAGTPVLAQPAPPRPATPAAPVDPKQQAAQTAFEALPEAERKAIQDDLIWASEYSGATTGSFGRLTYNGITTFQKAANLPDTGVLDAPARAALADAARKARAAAKFAPVSDTKTGARIGVAGSWMPVRSVLPTGTRWMSPDGRVSLETALGQGAAADLPAGFDRVLNLPGRKVTYKLLRPDFFVVTGEAGTQRFYTRYGASAEAVRGFTLNWDAAQDKAFNRIVIATANSFEPFPGATPAAPPVSPPSAGSPPPPAVASATAPTATPPAPAAPAPPTSRRGSALAVGPGRLLTAAVFTQGCRSLAVAGKPAQVSATDPQSGLALVIADGVAAGAGLGLAETPAAGADLVVLTQVAAGNGSTLSATAGQSAATASRRDAVFGPLQAGGAGSVVLDRRGALVGVVTADPSSRPTVAGVTPAAAWELATATAVSAFLGRNGGALAATPPGAETTTGEIARRFGGAVQPMLCSL